MAYGQREIKLIPLIRRFCQQSNKLILGNIWSSDATPIPPVKSVGAEILYGLTGRMNWISLPKKEYKIYLNLSKYASCLSMTTSDRDESERV